jgi:hypothetical protein
MLVAILALLLVIILAVAVLAVAWLGTGVRGTGLPPRVVELGRKAAQWLNGSAPVPVQVHTTWPSDSGSRS